MPLSRGLGITSEESAFYAEEQVKTLFAFLGAERNKSIGRTSLVAVSLCASSQQWVTVHECDSVVIKELP